jgi:hypothetical protein
MYIPTYAKRRQYIAAIIGVGIDAKTAPNFPANATQKQYHHIKFVIIVRRSIGA